MTICGSVGLMAGSLTLNWGDDPMNEGNWEVPLGVLICIKFSDEGKKRVDVEIWLLVICEGKVDFLNTLLTSRWAPEQVAFDSSIF